MTLESEPFSYRETAEGTVMIDWNGRRATVLTGAKAGRLHPHQNVCAREFPAGARSAASSWRMRLRASLKRIAS